MESVHSEVFNKKEPAFYLFKHKDIDGLQLPLKGSSRIKYISFNVSSNYIALGTNAGGIHIFRRSSLRHYRFLNAKVFPQPDSSRIVDIGVTTVLFSPQEKLLAAALSSGHVAVWILNFDKREASQLVKKADEHKGSTVTSLCWNTSSTKLFIGDGKGCVTGLEVSSGMIRRVHFIIKEGPAIVQLDFADENLLISNTKRCVYYHPSKEDLVQIGTKERDGLYGACFLFRQDNNEAGTSIYCARPGARLWQVDSSGQVLSTQQYKKLLSTTSSPIMGHLSGNEKGLADKCDTYVFPKLLVLRDQYLITWTRENIIVLDPILGNLILWNNQLENIEDICCNRQDVYVFHTGGRVSRYSLIPPKECAAKLFVMGDWLQCSKVLISCKSQIIPVTSRDHVPHYVVRRVKEMLNDNLQHEEIVRELTELEENLERVPYDPTTSEDSVIVGASSFDESESRSIASEVLSNPGSDNMSNTRLDSGMEDEDSIKTEKKEKLTTLKTVLKSQLKEFSLDSVLLAGAKAAGHMSFPSSYAAFGSGPNVKPFSSSWDVKSSIYHSKSPSESEGPGSVSQSDVVTSSTSISRNESVGSWEDPESDTEERKIPLVFKQKKKKKMKVHTIDIVSPLQPTDLIKLEKSKAMHRDDNDPNFPPPKTVDGKLTDVKEKDAVPTHDSTTVIHTPSQDSKEGLRSRSVAAKQEVVQKARKFLKRLTPEEKEMGSDETTKTFGRKGSGSKGTSTNITSPLEVKSLVIISRETRKKVRETQQLYNPRALKSSLSDWILYLEKANYGVNLVYPKNKETREYYVTDVGKVLSPSVKADLTRFLDSDDTTNIAELTTMCFRMKIYSSGSGKGFDVEEEELTMEELLKCDTCKQKQIHVSLNSDSIHFDKELMPSDDALKSDLAKTRFLCENFQLLRYQTLKGPVIAGCLNHRHLLKNLLHCLDGFTERDAVDDAIDIGDTKVALQLMKERAVNYQKRLLRHVFRLYYLVPRDVSKLCAEIFPYLDPWEVVLVCLSSSTNLHSNCSDFLIYVTHLIQNHAKKTTDSFDILNEVVSSEDFLILVYHSALILDDLTDSDVRCQCGWPRPGSHQTSFQYEELMIDIIKNFEDNRNMEALKKLLKISWNHGYWQGCIQLLVMLGLRTDALKLSLQLGDISLLNSAQTWGWLPQSLFEWKFGLEYLAGFQVNTDLKAFEKNVYSKLSENDVDNENDDSDRCGATNPPLRDLKKNVNHRMQTDQEKPSIGDTTSLKSNGKDLDTFEGRSFETLRNENIVEIKERDVSKFDDGNRIGNDEHGKGCEEKGSESFEFDEKENNEKTVPSFSDKACENQIPNLTNGGYSEQHTCIKSTISAEHRSLCIDLKSYVLVMLQKLGAKQTLKIISDSQLQKFFFTEEFYYKCILSSLLENHQSPLSHRILREVNDYMWSSKCAALLPQVYQMKEVEMSSSSKEELFNRKEPIKYSRSLEDAACNWGIDLPLAGSSCCSCPLPLCDTIPGHTQGVLVFSCGHLYHKECNLENYCNLQIPLKDVNIAQSSFIM